MQLIDHGCDVNGTDSEGTTALHHAVMAGLEKVVSKLLISGSDTDRCDCIGDTPLHIACLNGNQRLVDILIASGANLRAVNWENTLEEWSYWDILNGRNTKLLYYIICQSKQCQSLKNLCYIKIRKTIRNVENDATKLGLPEFFVKRLQFKD
ncbi:ankyrin repeat domain-containing protein 54-like [Stegodyphus dumicola]|uniref:ankyrin repeat domain-containing protein 54-like n=1 Tax=Stegodyphus dumicola TaxID=202533 RepID=UPI0015AE1396|nr:ankyrin repeat domain-containing protein 54-like [Stegodyphus dumicola]